MAEVELRTDVAVTAHSAVTIAANLTSDYYWYQKDGSGPKYVEVNLAYSAAPTAITYDVEHSVGGVIWNVLCSSTNTAGDVLNFFAPQGFFRLKVRSHTASGAETVTATVTLTNQLALQDFGDVDVVRFGAGNDVSFQWDGTNFLITPVTDDTGIFKIGNGTKDMDFRVTLGAAADYFEGNVGNKQFVVAGAASVILSGVSGTVTEGAVLQLGTAAAPTAKNTADTAFISGNFVNDATSGTTRGLQITLDVGGTLLTYVEGIKSQLNLTAAGNIRNPAGIQADLNFSTNCWVQGLGYGIGTWISFPASTSQTGTFTGVNIEFNIPTGWVGHLNNVTHSMIRFVIGGTAAAQFDTSGYLAELAGFTAGSGKLVRVNTSAYGNMAGSLRIKVGGTTYFIPFNAAEA